MKISIIGAGPIGLYTAIKLADNGFDVDVFEEHSAVGQPIQCTGLVTRKILDFIQLPDEVLANEISNVCIHKTRIQTNEFVIHRNRFDRHLEQEALKRGAKIHFNSMFQGYEKSTGNIIISSNKEKKTAPADILIGADGPLSKVSRYFFQYRPKFFSTIQFIIRNEKASNEYKVQFHREFKDFFIWQVPRNQFLMIGTATMQHINLKQKFLEYLKREKVIQSDHDVVKIESGLIPMFDYKRKIHITLEDSPDRLHHVFLVGDAAGQVKASTGGGIVSGLKFANLLSESITSRHYSQYRFKLTNCYNLILHKKVRGAFNSFSETDYQALMAILNRPHMKKILCETTRDEPWKLLLRFFINNPAFILSRARLFRSIL